MLSAELESLLAELWRALEDAVDEREAPLRLGVLATQSEAGPDARTVVLRAACRRRAVLEFHTDQGSAKCRQLAQDPRVAWCFHQDPLQLRISGSAALLQEHAVRAAAWRGLGRYSRGEYLPRVLDQTVASVGSPPVNFRVYEVQVQRIDWLQLDRNGHRRAAFARDAVGIWSGRWLQS